MTTRELGKGSGVRVPVTHLLAAASAALALTGVTSAAVGLPRPAAARTAQTTAPVAGRATAPPRTAPVARPALDTVPVAPTPAARPAAPARVAPLGRLRAPDLLVALTHPLTPGQLAALRRVRGLAGLALLDAGPVRVAGRSVHAVGVDPSQFRAFTPRETASSDALWQAVARGEAAPTYGLSRAAKLPLGGTIAITGRALVRDRVGAVAVFGVPGADLVVDRGTARSLGLPAGTGALLAAPGRGILGLQRDVLAAVGDTATLTVMRPAVVTAYKGKPRNYRELYMASARYCPGLSWKVLAAIGQVESNHGRDAGESSAGALGPMQFLPSTWVYSGVDGDGDGKADITNPFDAVPAAALYLCRDGAGAGGQALYDAIFSYNHSDAYVREVLALADQYT